MTSTDHTLKRGATKSYYVGRLVGCKSRILALAVGNPEYGNADFC